MSQGSQKNYIFVSNNCQHSKRLIGQLQNTTLLQSFQVVNIDDPRVQLPAFVQCVPTLYIPSKRQVLTDSHLFQWFEEAIKVENETKNKVNMADVTGDASILPFQNSEMGSGLSGSTYSFLEEDKNDLMNQNFSFLQDRDINKMPEFTRFDANSGSSGVGGGGGGSQSAVPNRKTGGNTDNAYETMMKSRGSEMQQRGAPQTPNFSSPY
jgi:hypothetical protein